MFTDIANFTHFMSIDEKKSLDFLEQKIDLLAHIKSKKLLKFKNINLLGGFKYEYL